jgi:hypothetical protein
VSGASGVGRGIRAGVRRLFRLAPRTRAMAGDDADAELDAFLDARTEHLVARGMPPAEARAEALRRLGAPLDDVRASLHRSAARRERRRRALEWADALHSDGRFALRQLARSPAFTATAVLVLALGIGATTAIFSAVRAVVLRPLPFAQPDRLYALWESSPELGGTPESAAPSNYLDWKERVSSFADVEAYRPAPEQVTITGLGEPLVLDGVWVTGGFFSMLGLRPMLGRDFSEAETWAEATWRAGEVPLLLSARTWRTVFGGEASAVGRVVELNGARARVVGVMPEGFAFPSEAVDLWAPFGWASENRGAAWFRQARSIRPIARLAAGVTAERARAELETVAARLGREHPATNARMGAGMSPLHAFLVGDTRTPLIILLGAVGLMLLIACANVGNLLLVRTAGRRRELAVRAALGAGRGRIVRQLATESLALALLGGAFGMALGVAGTRLLERLQPAGLLQVTAFPVDAGVVAFAALATAAAALLFGALPALLARRAGAGETLRAAGRAGGAEPGTRRIVGGLVVAEVAVAALLVLGAGLLVRSTMELRRVDPGFEADRVVAVSLNLPGARYRVRRPSSRSSMTCGPGSGRCPTWSRWPSPRRSPFGTGAPRATSSSPAAPPTRTARRSSGAVRHPATSRRWASHSSPAAPSPMPTSGVAMAPMASRSSTRRWPAATSQAKTPWGSGSRRTVSRTRPPSGAPSSASSATNGRARSRCPRRSSSSSPSTRRSSGSCTSTSGWRAVTPRGSSPASAPSCASSTPRSPWSTPWPWRPWWRTRWPATASSCSSSPASPPWPSSSRWSVCTA